MRRNIKPLFFAIVFLQSSVDKLLDQEGNLGYFAEHFKSSAIGADKIPFLFWALTAIEGLAGVLCALGILVTDFAHEGFGFSACGVVVSGIALLCLLFGQRIAKDYAGAAVVASYFPVALIVCVRLWKQRRLTAPNQCW